MSYRTKNVLVVGIAGVAALVGAASPTPAQVSSITWHEVGDPGNEAWDDPRYPNARFRGRGSVGYAYRMSETELTTNQWIEFVRAYGPYAQNPFDLDLIGIGISGRYVGGELVYTVNQAHEGVATITNWRYAARFCNWMHNGQVNEAWAFERGAYDTSTFNDDGPPFTDQDTRSPGAKYWIPSMDEWMKAAYYDPDRYGEGQAGWWDQPNRSNEPLISALPEDGGQTNADLNNKFGWGPHLRAGQYPDEQSPWGLLDLSGGWYEWTEEWNSLNSGDYDRYTKGSSFDDWDWSVADAIYYGNNSASPETASGLGVRIASSIPSPGGTAAFAIFAVCFARKRRRR
ncbi:MAG: SUMF1/EgtB/PvdO family nonheme iron enzyme [Phycisphaerales bacterium]|nr:SUMF1/EgtB/PvdO family nonheme iron enzyme [Phycisphaerales bacterium]